MLRSLRSRAFGLEPAPRAPPRARPEPEPARTAPPNPIPEPLPRPNPPRDPRGSDARSPRPESRARTPPGGDPPSPPEPCSEPRTRGGGSGVGLVIYACSVPSFAVRTGFGVRGSSPGGLGVWARGEPEGRVRARGVREAPSENSGWGRARARVAPGERCGIGWRGGGGRGVRARGSGSGYTPGFGLGVHPGVRVRGVPGIQVRFNGMDSGLGFGVRVREARRGRGCEREARISPICGVARRVRTSRKPLALLGNGRPVARSLRRPPSGARGSPAAPGPAVDNSAPECG